MFKYGLTVEKAEEGRYRAILWEGRKIMNITEHPHVGIAVVYCCKIDGKDVPMDQIGVRELDGTVTDPGEEETLTEACCAVSGCG